MRVMKTTALAIAGALLIVLVAGASAVKIKKTELPEAVRAAVDRHAPDAHIRACWRIAGDGEEMYEVDLKKDGIKKGFIFAANGKVLTIQEEVSWQDLPGEVQESLQRMAREEDGVINAASSDERGAVESMLEALAGSGKPFLHTSGSSIVGDMAGGEPGGKIYDEETPIDPLPGRAERVAIDRLVLASAGNGVRFRNSMASCLSSGRCRCR